MNFRFSMAPHGLGDQVNAIHALTLWRKRGYDFHVHAGQFEWLWQASGFRTVPSAPYSHPWPEPPLARSAAPWDGNKTGFNLGWKDWILPYIGPAESLWPELLATRVRLTEAVPVDDRKRADSLLSILPRPVITCHFHGVSSPELKDFSPELERDTVAALRELGSVLVIGQDVRPTLPELYELIRQSDLFLGIDSGPYHLARMTGTPRIGCWWGIPAYHAAIPQTGDINLSAPNPWNSEKAEAFGIREVPEITTKLIADTVAEKLNRA